MDMSPPMDYPSTPSTASQAAHLRPNSGYCVDHDNEDEHDDGDEWLTSLQPCSMPGVVPKHVHIKIAVEEKKRKFL